MTPRRSGRSAAPTCRRCWPGVNLRVADTDRLADDLLADAYAVERP